MDTSLILFGILAAVLIAAGGYGLMWCNKRGFHRRNAVGIEEFESFGKMFLIRVGEGSVAILCGIAITIGVLLLFWKLFAPGFDVQQFITNMLHHKPGPPSS